MRPSAFTKTMFRSAFDATRDQQRRLAVFLTWLTDDDAHEKISRDALGPDKLWEDWASETFIGFSSSKIMLQSGHAFSHSERVPMEVRRLPWSKRAEEMPNDLLAKFSKFHPCYKIHGLHRVLFDLHPNAFLRSAEAVMLSGAERPARMIEIGAGNAVHVAYRHLLNRDMQTTVVDLPESAIVGFVVLQAMGIEACLPNEVKPAAVTFRLPYQSIDGTFDFAFNMSSFQEMRPKVVSAYFDMIVSKCQGVFQNVNYETSRYISGNAIKSYPYPTQPTFQTAPFHSSLAPSLPSVISATCHVP